MADDSAGKSLLEDLEAIRSSLDRIARAKPSIPTLEEIVARGEPARANPDNPFLSSESLSELIRIRNEAEARAAEELANLEPPRPIDDILGDQNTPAPAAPDPTEIQARLEQAFGEWIDDIIADYLALFERDLRQRLQQDFRQLVAQWYRDHDLPLPDGFAEGVADDDAPDPDQAPTSSRPT